MAQAVTVAGLRDILASLAPDMPVVLTCESDVAKVHPLVELRMSQGKSDDGEPLGMVLIMVPPDHASSDAKA